jgi:1,4-alpha-glucan branching enzyme
VTPPPDEGLKAGQVTDLLAGRCSAPFAILGLHPFGAPDGPGRVIRVFLPWARHVSVIRGQEVHPMERVHRDGLYRLDLPEEKSFFPYRLEVVDARDERLVLEDPYRFGPAVDEGRVMAFLHGDELRVHEVLGARVRVHEGAEGALFAVWAPHARAVNLMGDMNGWDGRCHPMRSRGATGVWELFVPGIRMGCLYKYEIVTAAGERLVKADPCGRAVELRPATASAVWDPGGYAWEDASWMEARRSYRADDRPMSVYEAHLGSWRRPAAGSSEQWLSYRELADELLPYVADLGFTHLEILPVLEHPLDQSWGYQPLGFFAPTSRYGTPDDFRHFVDRAHRLGLGVLLDWVPGHFPRDAHGLALFDGTELYEHPDPRQALHPDWGTLTFDFGKPAVRSFLISSAIHWLEDYHLDGVRVDAVASMLYLDYSREEGEWVPNRHGGRENLEAVDFLKRLNDAIHRECPGAILVAEESTSWPRVSHGTDRDGLGFDQKWNMGWMNDTLAFMEAPARDRSRHYHRLTFSMVYAYSERFVLPLSHDEVVHGKRSLVAKMPGDPLEQLAHLRTLLAFQWAHPGKKLLFMGGELAQWREWSVDGELDWALLEHELHRGMRSLVRELNRLHRVEPALHVLDFQGDGFEWLDCHDHRRGTLSFLRWAKDWKDFVVVLVNFSPVRHEGFRLAVPFPGPYEVILDADAREFGGSGALPTATLETRPERLHGRHQVLELSLAPLTALYIKKVSP